MPIEPPRKGLASLAENNTPVPAAPAQTETSELPSTRRSASCRAGGGAARVQAGGRANSRAASCGVCGASALLTACRTGLASLLQRARGGGASAPRMRGARNARSSLAPPTPPALSRWLTQVVRRQPARRGRAPGAQAAVRREANRLFAAGGSGARLEKPHGSHKHKQAAIILHPWHTPPASPAKTRGGLKKRANRAKLPPRPRPPPEAPGDSS